MSGIATPTNDAPTGVQPRKAAFVFIWITVALDMLAVGVIVPVLPKLIVEFQGGDVAAASSLTGVFGSVWALMQLLAAPVLGAASDRFGRRPLVLLSNLGLGLDYLLMAWAPTVAWLFVGRVVSGITAASFPIAAAYISDVTPPEKRAARFGLLGAAFGLGFVVGPAVGGLLGNLDLRLPFLVAGGLSLLNFLYGVFVLPESLPVEKRSKFAWKTAHPIAALSLLKSNPVLLNLGVSAFLVSLAHEALTSVFVLYTGERYHWNERDTGIALGVVGVASMVVQGGLVGPVVRRFGEKNAIMAGLLLGACGFAIYGLAPVGWAFMLGIPVFGLMGVGNSASQSYMSKVVPADRQGQLQGTLQAMRGITGMVGPILFTQVFSATLGARPLFPVPGAPYLLASLLVLIAFGVVVRVLGRASNPAAAPGIS